MKNLNNGSAVSPPPQNLDNFDISVEGTPSIMSLTGLVDLLTALETELATLPIPLSLFATELRDGISVSLAVTE